MGLDKNINSQPENLAASLRDLVSKVTEKRYCLNNVLLASKLKKLRKGRVLIEQTNRKLSELAKKNNPACKSGCSYCCHQIFKVSSLELEVITFHLMNNPTILEAFLNNYMQRQRESQEELQQLYTLYTKGSSEEQREVSLRYFEKAIPCAFLNQYGACKIYDVRPIVCAGFISSDAVKCSKNPSSGFVPGEMFKLFNDSNMKLEAASKELGAYADLSTMIFRHLHDLAERGAKSIFL